MFNLNISEYWSVRIHISCGNDLGWSIKMATDNVHSIGMVKPVYGIQTFQVNAKDV